MLSYLRPNTYKTPLSLLTSDFYDYHELEDEAAAMLLSQHIWKLLKKAKNRLSTMPGCEGGASGVSVMVPADFLNRLARDVVRMTEGEANGIRGCTLHIEYTDGAELVKIGKIKCDPHLPSSSLLHLRLARAKSIPKPGNPLMRILGFGSDNIIYVSPGYTLEKRRVMNEKKRVRFQNKKQS